MSDKATPAAAAWVLDTSVLLAWLWKEPGDDAVLKALSSGHCGLSAVNLAELLTKLSDAGLTTAEGMALVEALEVLVAPFDTEDAAACATLRPSTRAAGLSLGDRACPALAQRLGAPVMTADRAWLKAPLGLQIQCIRPKP